MVAQINVKVSTEANPLVGKIADIWQTWRESTQTKCENYKYGKFCPGVSEMVKRVKQSLYTP
jgi:hypothetical protein